MTFLFLRLLIAFRMFGDVQLLVSLQSGAPTLGSAAYPYGLRSVHDDLIMHWQVCA